MDSGKLKTGKKNSFGGHFLSYPWQHLPISSSVQRNHRIVGPVNPSAYSFSSNKVLTEGVPNSVVFHYDASAASSDDSVFIVQDWDMSRRTLVSKTGHAHSAIYYYPGYFNAKLVVDTQIVQTHGLLIGSGGWLAMAEGEPEPFYFKKEEYISKGGRSRGRLCAPGQKSFAALRSMDQRLLYKGNGFRCPTIIFPSRRPCESIAYNGAEACQRVEVFIHCKNDVFIFPSPHPACIGDLQLYAQGKRVSSKEADLSGFGADLTQWTNFKIVTVNRHMQFIINNRPVYALDFPNPPTDIVGVQYRFQGGGSVKDTRFISQGDGSTLDSYYEVFIRSSGIAFSFAEMLFLPENSSFINLPILRMKRIADIFKL